jgi:hypothetical protein
MLHKIMPELGFVGGLNDYKFWEVLNDTTWGSPEGYLLRMLQG